MERRAKFLQFQDHMGAENVSSANNACKYGARWNETLEAEAGQALR